MDRITNKQEKLINIAFIVLYDDLNGMSSITTVMEETLNEWGRIELADFMSHYVRNFTYQLIADKWKIKYSGKKYKKQTDIKKQLFNIIKLAAKDGNLSENLLGQIKPMYYDWLTKSNGRG